MIAVPGFADGGGGVPWVAGTTLTGAPGAGKAIDGGAEPGAAGTDSTPPLWPVLGPGATAGAGAARAGPPVTGTTSGGPARAAPAPAVAPGPRTGQRGGVESV